jgi:hypothetical protein
MRENSKKSHRLRAATGYNITIQNYRVMAMSDELEFMAESVTADSRPHDFVRRRLQFAP